MQVANFIDALRSDLDSIAAVGDEPAAEAGRRLSHALQAAANLRSSTSSARPRSR
jgi:hypothetical protein